MEVLTMVTVGRELTIQDIVSVSRYLEKVSLDEGARARVRGSRLALERLISSGVRIYGVNTGLGALCNVMVDPEEMASKSADILMEHATGLGDYAPIDWVRAAMLIRAHQLSLGYSGVREAVIERLLDYLNYNLVPAVPRYGSVGASGDLAPLSHIALALIGKGHVIFDSSLVDVNEALKKLGMEPLKLSYKEALSLINGTSYTAGVAALGLHDSLELVKAFVAVFSLTLDAIGANLSPLSQTVNSLKKHRGQLTVAKAIGEILEGREGGAGYIQDPYSIRCVPQVVGSILDSLSWSMENVINEVNSVSDNPVIVGNAPYSSCHFHGGYVALSADLANASMAILGNLIERLIVQLLRAEVNKISDYLAEEKASVGYMIAQYTAASLTAKLRELASPSSVHNIPTSGHQEDMNPMSSNSAIKLHEVVSIVKQLLSILALLAYAVARNRKLAERTSAVRRVIDESIEGAPFFKERVEGICNALGKLAAMVQLSSY